MPIKDEMYQVFHKILRYLFIQCIIVGMLKVELDSEADEKAQVFTIR